MIQIGIRGPQNSEESWQASEDAGIRVIYMEEFSNLGIEATLDEVRHVVGQRPTYLSFDIDSLDPAFAPGTGTPEIGGLSTIQAQALIRGLADLSLVGADVVEVSPPFDPSGNTALVGASILFEIACILAKVVVRGKGLQKKT
jgi:guanidinopropionase